MEKKAHLEQIIKNDHPRSKIMYTQINDRQKQYFLDLSDIYNGKCAYCGTSIRFTGIFNYEVDHYICESSFSRDTSGRIDAGKVENLIFSCRLCNRKKDDLFLKSKYQQLLNPDNNSITGVFHRDENYDIKINNAHKTDDFVNLFYNKLMFGSYLRRLDFMLLEIEALIIETQDSNIANGLKQ